MKLSVVSSVLWIVTVRPLPSLMYFSDERPGPHQSYTLLYGLSSKDILCSHDFFILFRLCKEKEEEEEGNKDLGIFLPLPRSSGLINPEPGPLQSHVLSKLQKLVQAKDTSLWEHTGRESQGSTARGKEVGNIPPQSAPP